MTDLTNTIQTGDCFDVLDELPAESVHAVVTDPPYFLGDGGFMGREWDDFSDSKQYQLWCEEWATECKRVLKPGGHLLAFSGNRTHHRLFTGVEDAGFEIRDTLTWHYGSGFPKASDISKTIDKRADAEREVGPERVNPDGGKYSDRNPELNSTDYGDKSVDTHETLPATDAAKQWDGWKTGLKPATEFVCLARKPFDGATVDCVLEHGTGALNIDATRIDTDEYLGGGAYNDEPRKSDRSGDARTEAGKGFNAKGSNADIEPAEGRYPANLVLDPAAAEWLDRQVGETSSGPRQVLDEPENSNAASGYERPGSSKYTDKPAGHLKSRGDSGGPSRYFKTHEWRDIDEQMQRLYYTSKATKAERTLDGRIANAHPTVKPQDLMEWLVRLVTHEGQTVLDPFAGSGTTCAAAKALGREFVGIEQQDKWADVARVRVGLTPEDPARVRDDDAQQGLEAFTDGGGSGD